MDITDKLNMTMLCDFYELTMGNGYLEAGLKDRITYFDIFFRDVPDHGGYAICAGLERIIAYIQDLHFSEEDIEYLRSKDLFSERFLDYLRDFKFTGDVWAIPEGTPIFPREPIITVRAPAIQAQLVETFLLLIFNHQSLVATKTNRIGPGGGGTCGAGVRFPPGTGHGRRHLRRPGCLYRRLRRYGLHHFRPAFRRSRRRHHGPCLGADVRLGV